MAKKGDACAGCLYSRDHTAIPGKLECHIRSVDSWPVRSTTSWCGEWRDPKIVYQSSYQPRVRGLARYLNQLLTWLKG